VLQYKVIKTVDSIAFEKAVMEAAAEGWEPQGGVSVLFRERMCDFIYCQAMVKRPDEFGGL